MSKENGLRESTMRYGGTALDELSHAELLEAAEAIWRQRNEDVAKLEAECKGLKSLLASPLPIHSLWRGFGENVSLLVFIASVVWLIARHP